MSAGGSRLQRRAIPAVAFLLVSAGCGTRVDRAADSAATAQHSQSPQAQSASASVSTIATSPPETPAVGASGATSGAAATGAAAPGAAGAAPAKGSTPSGKPGAPSSGSAAGSGAAAQGSSATPGGGAGGPATSDAPPGQAATPGPTVPLDSGPKSPLVVASVGTYSGPVGVVLSGILYGAQTWVKHINAKGGLNGHPVQLIVFDDGGDPARHRAQLQTAIEQKKAVAFFANAEVFTGESSVGYINEKRIPIIGSDTGESWAYSSPMYFMQGPAGDYLVYTMLTMAGKIQVPLGKTKLGLLACAEVVACQRADDIRAKHAGRLGFQSVYAGKASIAQPDFTAECLAARNAGTQTFVVIMDTNSLGRVAAACNRQGFRPTYVNVAGNLLNSLAGNPDFEGLLGNSNVSPFFQTDTPVTAEFHTAVKTYGQKAEMGVGLITGWVAGKLLERAGAQLPEPPTTEALLKGLWSIKNDTLGGLSPQALTFTENRPAAGMACWYAVEIRKGAWASPDRFSAHCDPTPL
jgi:branched-chain amino acid transport system substrate-binding protein